MKPENIEEAKRLANSYRNITKKNIEYVIKNEIEEYIEDWSGCKKFRLKKVKDHISTYYMGRMVMYFLTGFSSRLYCTLCKAVNNDCDKCVWSYGSKDSPLKENYCIGDNSDDDFCYTYDKIEKADTADKLLHALKKRAKLIEETIKLWEEEEYENPFLPQEEGE